MRRHVVSIRSRGARNAAIAGGKASALARLSRSGHPVPPGFVVTTDLCDRMIRAALSRAGRGGAARAAPLPWNGEAAKEDIRRFRDAILVAPFPRGAGRRMREAFEDLGGSVAVRSSLVGEDGARASFAGQLDSFLDVDSLEALYDAVRRCIASTMNERFIRYVRERAGTQTRGRPSMPHIAVLAQRMVPAVCAGVAFTADPLTARRCTIIEAAAGRTGEAASGTVTPDRYVLDAGGALLESRLLREGDPLLNENQVAALAGLVSDVSDELGSPQDIEWAWDGERFHLLQARPITSLAGSCVYSSRLVSDMIPGVVKPLLWSTNVRDMTVNVFGRLFSEILGSDAIDCGALITRIRSRVYANVSAFGAAFEKLGLPVNVFEMIVHGETAQRRGGRKGLRALGPTLRLGRWGIRRGRAKRDIERFIDRHDALLDRFRRRRWENVDPRLLLDELSVLRRSHAESQWYVWIGALSASMRSKIVRSIVERCASDLDAGDLLSGLRGLMSLEPNRELEELARLVAPLDPGARAVLESGEDGAIRAALRPSEAGRKLIGRFDAFMERYGFLSAAGTDFSLAPWIENPSPIWRGIAERAARPARDDRNAARTAGEAARETLRRRVPWWIRPFASRVIDSTADYLLLRERIGFFMSEDAYQMRRIYLALGDHLTARGALGERDDVFYLYFDELCAILNGTGDERAARLHVAERRAEIESDAGLEVNDVVCSGTSPLREAPPRRAEGCLEGIAGSGGIARGRARIVRDPAMVDGPLTKEEILVVPFTDVGWTPLVPSVGGIVAETGGQLSHSAIIAREYGVPAVVSVRGALSLIRDGQPITVDGGAGRVYLDHVDQP